MRRNRIAALLAVALLALSVRAGAAEEARWARTVRVEGRSLSLEIASRHFAPRDGQGPTVALVGVVHVGDAAYYRALERHLARYEVVLYESVKPSGAGAPGGETDEERAGSTRRALRFLASLVEAYRTAEEKVPADAGALLAWLHDHDVRLEDFAERCLTDAWGGPVDYAVGEEAGGFVFTSPGADGLPGGEGPAADLSIGSGDEVPAWQRPEGDSLQVTLAKTLRLTFQLDEIDYGPDGWIPCDMAMDQVERAIAARGGDAKALSGSLTGSAFAEGFARIALGLVRLGDVFTGGMLGDTMKAMMIEMLGDESMDLVKEGPLGEAVMRVIIDDRNQYVVDDLRRLLSDRPDLGSVAIFYGAGHMEDLAKRLSDRLGYEPVPESGLWFPAITLDLEESNVNDAMLERMRASIRARLRRMREK